MKKKNKKLQLWIVWPLGIVLAFIAIGLLLASLYINSEPMQKRIGAIIRQQIGDVVKFERAGLSIFPRPGLALNQVNINIGEGTFIRAESVNIYPQILPLLIGKVRIAKVKFEEPDIIVDIAEKPQQRAAKDKPSNPAEILGNVISVISSVQTVTPGLVAVVRRGKLFVRENNRNVAYVRKIYARIALEPQEAEIKLQGDVDKWGEFSVRGNVHVEKNSILINGLSGNTITMNNVQASTFDSSFTAAVVISQTAQAINSADVTMSGKIGPKTIRWVSQTFNLPPEQTLHAPVSISNSHIMWQAGAKLAVTATAAIEDGPTISLTLSKNVADLAVSELMIYDKESRANIALQYTKNLIDVSFQGSLTEKTLNGIFEHNSFHRGWIKGDFRTHVQLDQYWKSTAQGHLEGANFIIPVPMNVPIKVRRVILSAEGKTLKVESAALNWGENNFDIKGNVKAAPDGFHLDMDLYADAIKVETIKKNLAKPEKPSETNPSEKHSKKPALRGIIRLTAPSIIWGRYTASPLRANILLDYKGVNINITKAFLCGISIPGNLTFGENDIQFDFKPAAAGKQLESTLDCLFYEDSHITGILNLQAAVNSRGKSAALVSSLQGRVDFSSEDGIIYRFPLLAKIFSFLNVTELLRGKLPDFTKDGFKYNSMTIKGDIRQGVFVIKEALLDGTTMQLAGQGEINLTDNKINLTILVAPFKTVDYLIKNIPVVGYILKGTLISIPLKVTGDISDPSIFVLSPSAVGEGLLGMMKRTLSLPVKIIEPIIPRDRKEEK
jgi:uncharacterized protein involved in outer membrane biogenesis